MIHVLQLMFLMSIWSADGFSAKCMLLGPKTYQNIGGQNQYVNVTILGISNALLPSTFKEICLLRDDQN